jgi:hypothetical protein
MSAWGQGRKKKIVDRPLDSKKATKNDQLLKKAKEKQKLIAAVGRTGSVCMFWAWWKGEGGRRQSVEKCGQLHRVGWA